MIASVVLERGDADQIAARAAAIYREKYQDECEARHTGKFVAIDIDSETWEVDEDDFAAARRLRDRQPQARIWIMRVGSPTAYRIGGSRKTEQSK